MQKPDWRKGAGYPAKDASPRVWAWEFLRRNPKYRSVWQRFVSLADQLRDRYEAVARGTGRLDGGESASPGLILEIASDHHDERATEYAPPKLDGEGFVDWVRRVGKGETRPLEKVWAAEWALEYLLDPSGPPELFCFAIRPGGVVSPSRYADNRESDWFYAIEELSKLLEGDGDSGDLLQACQQHLKGLLRCVDTRKAELRERMSLGAEREQGRMLIEFDLSRPYMAQIEHAADWLESSQRRYKEEGGAVSSAARNEADHYAKYLRVLDALEEFGYPDSPAEVTREIVRVMLPNQNDTAPRHDGVIPQDNALANAVAWVKTATELRDGGYKALLLISGKSSRHSVSRKDPRRRKKK